MHPSLDRMRIGVDRGNARGNKTLFFSASAPPIARHTSPPDLAAAPHTPTRRLGAHEQLAESVGTAPLQLGSRQPCRPPPHTRASMVVACVPGLSRPPSRGGSGPLQATGVAGAQVRGRPKLPTPSACTDGSPYRFRVCAVSRACKVGTEHHFGRFGRFARTCTGTAHSRSGGGAAADGATSRTVVRPFGASEDGPGPRGAPCRQGRQLGRGTPHTPALAAVRSLGGELTGSFRSTVPARGSRCGSGGGKRTWTQGAGGYPPALCVVLGPLG
jgi:hypothetical protein